MSNIVNCKHLNLIHGTTNAGAGSMREKNNIAAWFNSVNVPCNRVLFLKQVHGNAVAVVNNEDDFNEHLNCQPAADAWVLTHNNAGVAVYTADCVPLFLWDQGHNVVGLAHSGWRSTVKNIAGQTAKIINNHPKKQGRISAFIGPHIRQCCFEFGQEARGLFSAKNIAVHNGKLFVNLENQIKAQLVSEGLNERDIHSSGICTFCDKNYFSFRRDKNENAIMSYIFKGGEHA